MIGEGVGVSVSKVRTICPNSGCPSRDGVIVTVNNGRISGIEGDKEHPVSNGFTCAKGLHSWVTMYHPQRFKQPLLKTASGWKEISWEDALETASDRLGEVKNRFGPLSFCATQCHPGSPEGTSLILLLNALGSPNRVHNLDLCMGPSRLADQVTSGLQLSIYGSAQDFRNSKCILLIGTNIAHSAGGQWQHITEAKRNGAKLIVVDPRRSESAKQADMWLQIRPGTDGALALAMLRVIINENLYDAEFVNTYCMGFDKLRGHVQEYTPERVAETTWLSPDEIVQAARIYATHGPSSYRGNNGIGQSVNSTQSVRAFSLLPAITGNIDVPGGNLVPSPSGYSAGMQALMSSRLPREVEEKRLGAARFPLWAGPDAPPFGAAHNPSLVNAMITGEPYPIKAMIVHNANPVVTYPDTRKIIEALKKLEFLVVIGYTPSPTSELADLILPKKYPYEESQIGFSTYGNFMSATPKIVDPPDGCRDPVQILHDICKKMAQKGYIQKNPIPWKDKDEFIAEGLVRAPFSFKELSEKGSIVFERQYKKYAARGFPTPSGKVELYSSILERYGYDPLPVYREPAESPLTMPKLAQEYPLLFTSRRGQNYYGSRSADESWFRAQMPYPQLQIHPSTARERGIRQGDTLVIQTPRGTIQHQAELTEDIHPKVVCGVFGWWLPERNTPDRGALETSVNGVTSYDAPHDPEIGINSVQGIMCQVGKLQAVKQQ